MEKASISDCEEDEVEETGCLAVGSWFLLMNHCPQRDGLIRPSYRRTWEFESKFNFTGHTTTSPILIVLWWVE